MKSPVPNPHADQPNAPPDVVIEDAVAAEGPTPEQMAKVVELAREQWKLLKEVDERTKDLKESKDKLTANQMVLLPKAMDEAGMDECPLGTEGLKVELYTNVTASIPSLQSKAENAVERNQRGIAYMEERAPSMVETVLTIRFAKGEEKDLKKFLADNKKRKKPIEMSLSQTVNTGSLGKWVREEIKAGRAVDEEVLSVHRIKIAEIVVPKKKKEKVLE